jgi:hypothetical protein
MRQRNTLIAVWIVSAIIIAVCLGWSVLVEHLVPTACESQPQPPRAQYLHCG